MARRCAEPSCEQTPSQPGQAKVRWRDTARGGIGLPTAPRIAALGSFYCQPAGGVVPPPGPPPAGGASPRSPPAASPWKARCRGCAPCLKRAPALRPHGRYAATIQRGDGPPVPPTGSLREPSQRAGSVLKARFRPRTKRQTHRWAKTGGRAAAINRSVRLVLFSSTFVKALQARFVLHAQSWNAPSARSADRRFAALTNVLQRSHEPHVGQGRTL